MTGVTSESLNWACKRLEEFYAVHSGGSASEMTAAVGTLREAFGLDDELADQFCEWVQRFVGEEHDMPMLLGLLVGLMASDKERW